MNAPLARQVLDRLQSRQAEIEKFIQALVEVESPSGDEEGSRAVVDLLVAAAGTLECVSEIDRVDVSGFGQHLVVRAFQEQSDAGQILLVGHTDTVHARGSLSERPWRREAGKIYGPGIFDMKANCALVMEPPASGGRVKTGRKGTGIFAIKVEGKAAHAGLEPEKGASAILELARQTEQLHALNLSGSGITLNVGVVHGGTRSNVVAAEAQGEIDVRFSTAAESQEIERILSNLQPIDERTKVFVSGGINRPPMERTAAVIELYEKAQAIAAEMQFDLGEAQVGGASDGNFLAAMGIPVLDGLGISGDGAHAVHEHIESADIARRGALLGALLMEAAEVHG